jgi:hypothetical protein
MEEPYREIFELRVFGELGFQQIGMIFGKTGRYRFTESLCFSGSVRRSR